MKRTFDLLEFYDSLFFCIYNHVMNDTEISLKLGRFVEGMAPVFSRSAWDCTWHLIQVFSMPIGIVIILTTNNT